MSALRVIALFMCASMRCTASHSAEEHGQLMRSSGPRSPSDGIRRVSIDTHSNFHSANPVKPPSSASLAAEGEATDIDNPCSSLGCNSHKCAWASGGSIKRLIAKKGCSNSIVLGNSQGLVGDSASVGQASTVLKISTLKECMNAVRTQSSSCSGNFQLHKDSLTCSCVPAGTECAESEDANMCRYQVIEE